MGKGIIAWENLADVGAIEASSELTTLPSSNLIDPQVVKVWRTADSSAPYIILNNFTPKAFQLIAMMGVNLSNSSSIRVRASNLDPSVTSSLLYDSGVVSSGVDSRFKSFVFMTPDEVTATYVRIDLSDIEALPYFQAGRLFVGPMWSPAVNYIYGWSRSIVDLSKRSQGRGGQIFVDVNNIQRVFSISYDFLTEEECVEGFLEIDRVIGLRKDVLVLLDSESTNKSRDSLWGMINDMTPANNPSFGIFQKQLGITERL